MKFILAEPLKNIRKNHLIAHYNTGELDQICGVPENIK